MTERDTGEPENGPRVGLASYQLDDPEATFRIIESFRPGPAPRRAGFATWVLRFLLTWSVNLFALATAGIVVTNVGAYDPFAYVAWAAIFGAVNAVPPISGRLVRDPRAAIVTAVVLLGVDVVLAWLMTVFARPFHSPDLVALAKVGAIMWFANLPLSLLYLRWRARPAPRQPA